MMKAALILLAGVCTAATAADVGTGSRVYATYCVGCHGATGESLMPATPNFRRGEGLMKPDAMLLGALRHGGRAMPAFAGILRDQEILDVIAYLRTLQR